jgi:hypothetical protein
MLGRIVKRDRLIEVRPTFRDVSRTRQGNTHDAMGYQERSPGSCSRKDLLSRSKPGVAQIRFGKPQRSGTWT